MKVNRRCVICQEALNSNEYGICSQNKCFTLLQHYIPSTHVEGDKNTPPSSPDTKTEQLEVAYIEGEGWVRLTTDKNGTYIANTVFSGHATRLDKKNKKKLLKLLPVSKKPFIYFFTPLE